MAVCNLFNKFNKTTGNFLMFSQYTEDLTKSATHQEIYRVVPSKFMVMNINYNDFEPEYNDSNLYDNSMDLIIPTYFQNYFENGCAFLRKNMEDWNPEISKRLFWNALRESHLIHQIEDEKMKIKYCNEILYIGDISIQTYDQYLGTGYNEIYCNIPSDSKSRYVQCEFNEKELYKECDDNIVQGYNDSDYKPKTGMCPINILDNTRYYYDENTHIETQTDSMSDDTSLFYRDLSKYDFNTIIVLYDVYTKKDKDFNLCYSDIPLGMYVMGLINNEEVIDDVKFLTTSNKSTKIVSNDDIYGLGTSYGLRICSRFMTTPNQDNIKPIDITVDSDNSYAATCMVLSKLSESIDKMNEIVEQCVKNSQTDKELYAIFKNSRTNVPYIKEINGKSYWFINGKNTYYSALSAVDLKSIHKDQIDELFRIQMERFFREMRLKQAFGYNI